MQATGRAGSDPSSLDGSGDKNVNIKLANNKLNTKQLQQLSLARKKQIDLILSEQPQKDADVDSGRKRRIGKDQQLDKIAQKKRRIRGEQDGVEAADSDESEFEDEEKEEEDVLDPHTLKPGDFCAVAISMGEEELSAAITRVEEVVDKSHAKVWWHACRNWPNGKWFPEYKRPLGKQRKGVGDPYMQVVNRKHIIPVVIKWDSKGYTTSGSKAGGYLSADTADEIEAWEIEH